jgi:DNA-directed RNA polymerase specialized sigma24 family protein
MERKWIDHRNKLSLYAFRYDSQISEVDRDELVADTMSGVFWGIRIWPEDVWPTDAEVEKFLRAVYRSKVSHWWEKELAIVPERVPSGEDGEARKPHRIKLVEHIEDVNESTLKKGRLFVEQDTQQQIERKQFFKMACEMLDDDQLLIAIFELWINDPGIKPQEIAEMLGVTIDEVNNALKRLRRILSKLKEQW